MAESNTAISKFKLDTRKFALVHRCYSAVFLLFFALQHTMAYSFCFVYLMLAFTATNANVITSKGVDCECFNSTQDVCRDNVARCVNSDSERPGSCFVLWATDHLTGLCFILCVDFFLLRK